MELVAARDAARRVGVGIGNPLHPGELEAPARLGVVLREVGREAEHVVLVVAQHDLAAAVPDERPPPVETIAPGAQRVARDAYCGEERLHVRAQLRGRERATPRLIGRRGEEALGIGCNRARCQVVMAVEILRALIARRDREEVEEVVRERGELVLKQLSGAVEELRDEIAVGPLETARHAARVLG